MVNGLRVVAYATLSFNMFNKVTITDTASNRHLLKIQEFCH